MSVIEGDDYRKTREALKADPIIQDMAGGVKKEITSIDDLAWPESGTPRHEFTMAALREYQARGGKIGSHIGGPAEAILMILKDESGVAAP